MSNPQQQQPQTVTNRRSLNGLVTKLVSDGAYGFINDEIFFPQTNVSGGPAGIGDQVYAECEYSANLPIKWNATSVKVLQKADSGASSAHPQASSESLLRQVAQQQDVMNQQQQQQQQPQPFANQGPPVAVTYQQHRQQRHQRQFMEQQQQQSQQEKPQTIDPQARSAEQQCMSPGGYFGNTADRTFNQQQQSDANIQPFHNQPPMGPPNFAFTSQLGSAFVQSHQFPAPAPFINQQQQQQQQPQTLLDPQQQQQQQHLLPNFSMLNQRNHHQQNKNITGSSRFNNQGDKNDRQMNRRNLNNRNEGKFESRSRGNDQDHGSNSNTGGTKRSKARNSRDRSLGRGSRRSSPPTRGSPVPNSSARSTTSINSDRGIKSRRHYEVQNIPRSRIMTNLNSANMKQRCPSSIHVPSDLKEVIVNQHFRFDLKNIPKPLRFSFEKSRDTNSRTDSTNQDKSQDPSELEINEDSKSTALKTETKDSDVSSDSEAKTSKQQSVQQPMKSDARLTHKYGVKVILISLPEFDSIYRSIFGSDLDSLSNTEQSKSSLKLDEVISLLCSKGSNNGHSLIGGKFDSTLDGFVEGSHNKLERNGNHPNLISTCKRVVLEQTGLDLSECQGWTLLSTFLYNIKSDYFSQKSSIEYSFVYMPHIWTMYKDIFDDSLMIPVSNPEQENQNTQTTVHDDKQSSDCIKNETTDVQENTANVDAEVGQVNENPTEPIVEQAKVEEADSSCFLNPDTLSDLKVADLKVELDKRSVKYKGLPKKAELVAMLREAILNEKKELEKEPKHQSTAQTDMDAEDVGGKETETEEIEQATITTVPNENESKIIESAEDKVADVDSLKRKSPEDERDDQETAEVKKTCLDGEKTDSSVEKKRVNLIKGSFVVYSKSDQSSLSLVSLQEATQAGRHDQFELSVSSSILKESLTQHLSEYILTTLVEDHRSRSINKNTTTGSSNGNISASSSQETTSDTNNNVNNSSKNSSSSFKNPADHKESVRTREYPLDRYINLAMSYFDAGHIGYLQFEDLSKLLNNTGLTISKRALLSIVGESEKLNYRTLPDLSPKLEPTYVYKFPEQFSTLPGASADESVSLGNSRTVQFEGVTYEVEKLVQQAKEAETVRVNLVDRFNYAIENSDKQAEEIHVLEVSQKSLARAIKAQNDEICDLKRERDLMKRKYEALKKGIDESISSLVELAKDDK